MIEPAVGRCGRLDDATSVTPQIFGVGSPRRLSERFPATTDLDILCAPLKSFACVAGAISRRIAGLFYRFQSAEGNDTICEFLIGRDMARPTLFEPCGWPAAATQAPTGPSKLPTTWIASPARILARG